jgi:hypothetical protein
LPNSKASGKLKNEGENKMSKNPQTPKRAIHKITTSGRYSKAVIIPREFLRVLNWREDQNVEIQLDEENKRLIIKDAKKK